MAHLEYDRELRKIALGRDYMEKTAGYPGELELLPPSEQIQRRLPAKFAKQAEQPKDPAIRKSIEHVRKNQWQDAGRRSFVTRG
ncbi:MAG: hypothetical protein OXI94_08335 [Gemmatimonadota bacterium]|nr:hypothetical protein [Gemmatimonadota bacterium]